MYLIGQLNFVKCASKNFLEDSVKSSFEDGLSALSILTKQIQHRGLLGPAGRLLTLGTALTMTAQPGHFSHPSTYWTGKNC